MSCNLGPGLGQAQTCGSSESVHEEIENNDPLDYWISNNIYTNTPYTLITSFQYNQSINQS